MNLEPIGTPRTTQIVRIWSRGFQQRRVDHHLRPSTAFRCLPANDDFDGWAA